MYGLSEVNIAYPGLLVNGSTSPPTNPLYKTKGLPLLSTALLLPNQSMNDVPSEGAFNWLALATVSLASFFPSSGMYLANNSVCCSGDNFSPNLVALRMSFAKFAPLGVIVRRPLPSSAINPLALSDSNTGAAAIDLATGVRFIASTKPL